MTAQSEVVRMGLYERVARDGLSAEQRDAVFRIEMRAYRDGLEQLSAEWRFRPEWAKVTDVDADLQVYEAFGGAFAKTGVVEGMPSLAYAQKQFEGLSAEQRAAARRLVGGADLRHSLSLEIAQRLKSLGIEANPTNMALATRLVLDARTQAARDMRLRIDSASGVTVPEEPDKAPPATVPVPPVATAVATNADAIPEKWHSNAGGSCGNRYRVEPGDARVPQRWKPRGNASGRADAASDPVGCGKSPRDRDPDTILQAIRDRALDRIDEGELEADVIGLDGITTNKHLRKLKQVYDLARDEIDILPEIRFAKFMVPDLKDYRDARDAYTVDQANEMCWLGPTIDFLRSRAVDLVMDVSARTVGSSDPKSASGVHRRDDVLRTWLRRAPAAGGTGCERSVVVHSIRCNRLEGRHGDPRATRCSVLSPIFPGRCDRRPSARCRRRGARRRDSGHAR